MAYKLRCSGCGETIVSKYLNPGERVYCKECGAKTMLGMNAQRMTQQELEDYENDRKKIDIDIDIKEEIQGEKRYTYKFEELEVERGFFSNELPGEYIEVIKRYSEKGWRFVQLFPIKYMGHIPSAFQLVFEKTVGVEEDSE